MRKGFSFNRFLVLKTFDNQFIQRRPRPLKGFMHIVEIIVIVLVATILLLQLSHIPASESQWDRTKLQFHAEDMLFILNEKGYLDSPELYIEEIKVVLDNYLSKNTIYKLEMIDDMGISPIILNSIKNPVKASIFKIQPTNDPAEIVLSLGYRF
ncbi:MAG: hypothetical protein ISS36_01695 [Candidatus Aenigmarchaeota archaeon]|nr:hypothetical protein [Candidatus Aenigmarchaeota archaeon]